MANDMMSVWPLVEKSADADLLREMIGFAAERLMELEVGSARVLNSAKRIHCGLHSATATVTANWGRELEPLTPHSEAAQGRSFPELS